MAINFKFEIDGEFLKVITEGKDDNLDDVINYSDSIIAEIKNNGFQKVLCDERNLEYAISVFDTYQLAEYASQQSTWGARIAIVCNRKYLTEGKFYETVASNRGLIVYVTSDYNSAVQWLDNQ